MTDPGTDETSARTPNIGTDQDRTPGLGIDSGIGLASARTSNAVTDRMSTKTPDAGTNRTSAGTTNSGSGSGSNWASIGCWAAETLF